MADTVQQYHGLGRRKTSVARVWLRPGTGKFTVNGRALNEYFPRLSSQQHVQEPLIAAQQQGRFDVLCNVDGGGLTGQAGAVRLGIARALLQVDPELRAALRERRLLTRDPREVERKKPGRPGARKRFQFSKR
ncbi:MAG TPA: 30S ribosomal protein S9 [Longimicrobiales bacterium]|nr:30S ribosomal protein S9 [Longimicrobiales bacterium]